MKASLLKSQNFKFETETKQEQNILLQNVSTKAYMT